MGVQADRAHRTWRFAEACYGLARVLRQRGQHEEPERLLREGLTIARTSLGPVDHRTSVLADELVDLLIEVGRPDDAEQVCGQTLALQHDRDPQHEQESATFWAYYRLAAVYTRTGKTEQARQTMRDALAACIEHAGPDSDLALTARAALGRTLYQHGGENLPEARRVLAEVAATLRERRGNNSPLAMATQADLALILADMGLLERAEKTAREAFALEREQLETHRFQISVTRPQLAEVLRVRGKLDEAERLLDEELGTPAARPRASSIPMLTIAENLAAVLVEQGRAGEAEPIVRDCLRARSGISWTSPGDVAQTTLLLGLCLGAQGGYADAEPLVLEGISGVLREGAPTTSARREAIRRVADFYERWTAAGTDKSGQAAQWRARLSQPATSSVTP